MLIKNVEKIAFAGKDFSLTYAELIYRIEFFTSLFPNKSDQKVLILSENRPEWVFALYAIWKNNSIAIPVDYQSSADEVAYILDDSKPEVVFCSADKKDILADAITKIDFYPNVLIFEEISVSSPTKKTQSPGIEMPELSKTAFIVYTSGTTNRPKGVILSFENLKSNVIAVSELVSVYAREDNILMLLPLHHILPVMGSVIIPFYTGCTVAMSPSTYSEDILQTLQKYKISIVIGVPKLYNVICKGIMDKINASILARMLFSIAGILGSKKISKFLFKTVHKKFGGKIKYLVSGGAAINKQVVQDFKTLGFELLEGYGLTEAAPMITFSRPSNVRLGSVGQLLPGTQVEIRDGEIVAKGKNIMKGYFNKPFETSEILKDGWLYTGDLGYMDKDGYLYITGRRKELIILSNGKNINPEETETKLSAISSAIKEVGVYSFNDTLQAVIYPDFVWLKKERIENIQQYFKWNVVDRYNAQSPTYKKILGFALVNEELPKTRLGKIQRFKLEKYTIQLKKREIGDVVKGFQEYDILKKFLEEQLEKQVNPFDHLELDLAIDSLGLVSLSVFLHTSFGIDIKENEFSKFESVLKLAEFIKENHSKIMVDNINWNDILKSPFHFNLPSSGITGAFLRYFSRMFLKFYFRIKAEGLSNLPEGPCIIASNHQSFFDGFFLNAIFKNKLMRKTYFYAKEKHFRSILLKGFARINNIIIMDINKDLKQSIQKLAEILKKGRNVIIFPEGTRSKDGRLGQFKKTFAILSQELNIPIVPVVIDGSFRALPEGSWFPKPFSRIKIKVLQPVYPLNHSYDSLKEEVYKKISGSLK